MGKKQKSWNRDMVQQAAVESFRKLGPRRQLENPVMFLVYISAALTTLSP